MYVSPGGSILKFPMRCLCPSMVHQPYSLTTSSFSALSCCFSSLVLFFLSSDLAAIDFNLNCSWFQSQEKSKALPLK